MTIRWLTVFLDFAPDQFQRGVSFWRQVTNSALSPPRGDLQQFATLLPPEGDAYLRVQRLDDGITGCHLDLHCDDAEGVADVALRGGASTVSQRKGFFTMISPGGFRFCVVTHQDEHQRPPALENIAGNRSIADQLTIDCPPRHLEREVQFWQTLTTWTARAGSRAQFTFLDRPAEMPVRIMFQRIDTEEDSCRAHLDFACDDVATEREYHVSLGATSLRETPDWSTLVDPVGMHYCLTRRSPTTGAL